MDNDKSEHIVEDNRTAAIVLAAGKGERFHGETHKLLADFKGKPILQWVIAVSYTHLTLPTSDLV